MSACEDVYVVVDTNALIHHRNVVMSLADTSSNTHNITLCFPWVVITELDGLKKSAMSDIAATSRDCIRVLNQWLAERKNNVLFQTAVQSQKTKELVAPRCNDDQILGACMCLRYIFPNCKVILASADINLQNKALIESFEVMRIGKAVIKRQKLMDHMNDGKHDVFVKLLPAKKILEFEEMEWECSAFFSDLAPSEGKSDQAECVSKDSGYLEGDNSRPSSHGSAEGYLACDICDFRTPYENLFEDHLRSAPHVQRKRHECGQHMQSRDSESPLQPPPGLGQPITVSPSEVPAFIQPARRTSSVSEEFKKAIHARANDKPYEPTDLYMPSTNMSPVNVTRLNAKGHTNCTLCRKTFASKAFMDEHLQSKFHLKKVAWSAERSPTASSPIISPIDALISPMASLFSSPRTDENEIPATLPLSPTNGVTLMEIQSHQHTPGSRPQISIPNGWKKTLHEAVRLADTSVRIVPKAEKHAGIATTRIFAGALSGLAKCPAKVILPLSPINVLNSEENRVSTELAVKVKGDAFLLLNTFVPQQMTTRYGSGWITLAGRKPPYNRLHDVLLVMKQFWDDIFAQRLQGIVTLDDVDLLDTFYLTPCEYVSTCLFADAQRITGELRMACA